MLEVKPLYTGDWSRLVWRIS